MVLVLFAASCSESPEEKKAEHAGKSDTLSTSSTPVELPAPYATESAKVFAEVIGWGENKTPVVPAGFSISRFADSLKNPRWIYVAANGDIFVAESATEAGPVKKLKSALSGKSKSQNLGSANQVSLFRDTTGDGLPDLHTVFLAGLKQPFGMLIAGDRFYVANTDGVIAYPYTYGQTQLRAAGKQIINLPAGGYNNHWTRNIVTNADSSKLYVSVGSGSNVGEHGMENELRRACILEFNMDGTGERQYAGGLRNPVGMDWAPGTNTLWTAVNERDELGDELVPDYMTSVKPGGFYGWPYTYWGQHEDPRMKEKQRPELVRTSIVPDVSLGAHTASLGLAFDSRSQFPGQYAGGAFIGQHGSWNRSSFSGYQVAFLSFKNGRPVGKPEPFVTGFIADSAQHKVYGRPVGVAFDAKGNLLVADDAANTIWMVRPRSNNTARN